MIHAVRLVAGTFALATSLFVAEASGAELKVLSAGAMRAALQELALAFEAASGNKLKIEYSTAGDIEKKVAAGGEIDVAILTKPRVDRLVSEAKIVGGSTQTLARAQIGLAVQKGAAKPDISSVEAFKKVVLNAKSHLGRPLQRPRLRVLARLMGIPPDGAATPANQYEKR